MNHVMSTTAKANEYLRTRVMTASPAELRLMLLDGAVRFARQGQEGLAKRNYEQSFEGLSRCREIITELIVTMRPEHDPALCEKVHALYTFIFNEVTEAGLEKNAKRMDRVIELLEYERETWAMLMEKLGREEGATRTSSDDSPATSGLSVEA